jgi:hypothetical protein
MLRELDDAAGAIEDDRVVVVRKNRWEDHVDAEALGRLGQTVEEDLVGAPVGPKQELPLGAPPGEHVEGLGQDLTRGGHDGVFFCKGAASRQPREVRKRRWPLVRLAASSV